MKIIANTKTIQLADYEELTSGAYNDTSIDVELSEEYSNLTVFVSFNDKKTLVSDGKIFTPCLQEGICKIGVYGISVKNEEVVLRYSPKPVEIMIAAGSWNSQIAEAETPAVSEAEKIYSLINDAIEKGKLKGADGAPGKDGKAATITITGATQTAAGTPLKVQNIGTSTAAELLFSFPAYSLTDYDYEQIQKQLPVATSSQKGVISVPIGCGISVKDDGSAKVNFPVTSIKSVTDDITVVGHSGGEEHGQFDIKFNGGKYALKSDLPTKTSELTNDSDFVSDSTYVHTDNNYTTADKTKLAGLSNYDDTAVKQSIAVKQDKLTDTQLNNISVVPNKQDKLSQSQLNNIANVTNKQDKLTVGSGLKLESNVLSLDIETATAQTVYGGDTQ